MDQVSYLLADFRESIMKIRLKICCRDMAVWDLSILLRKQAKLTQEGLAFVSM